MRLEMPREGFPSPHLWTPLEPPQDSFVGHKKNKLCCFHSCKSKQRIAKIWEFTGPEHIPLNKTRNQLVWESLREFKLGFFRRKVSSLTSCKRCFGFLIPALIFPAGFDFLAHLFLNIWGGFFDAFHHHLCSCSSLVFRRQLQSWVYYPLFWAGATSNGVYYYPPHSSGGNIQPRLGCLAPKLLPQGDFWEKRPGLLYPPVFLPIFPAA